MTAPKKRTIKFPFAILLTALIGAAGTVIGYDVSWRKWVTQSINEETTKVTAHESAQESRDYMTGRQGAEMKAELLRAITDWSEKVDQKVSAACQTATNRQAELISGQARIEGKLEEWSKDLRAVSARMDEHESRERKN